MEETNNTTSNRFSICISAQTAREFEADADAHSSNVDKNARRRHARFGLNKGSAAAALTHCYSKVAKRNCVDKITFLIVTTFIARAHYDKVLNISIEIHTTTTTEKLQHGFPDI